MKLPRFTLRFLLALITLVGVGIGVNQRLYVQRRVTVKETQAVEPHMAAWQVRWYLGARHDTDESLDLFFWTYECFDRESSSYSYFYVTLNKVTGRVAAAARH